MMKLLEPIKINQMELKNRMVVSAMVTNYCEEDGYPTEKFIAYHEHKAKGGWGLIITEDYEIMPHVGCFKRLPGLWSDEQIGAHRVLTDRVHAAGGKIVAQIYHAGREATYDVIETQSLAPSPVKHPDHDEIPREITVEEIHQITQKFGECAGRVKKAGFDGVEIHGAHGYILNQFLSPFSNKRTDEYGGTIANRMRFPLEVVRKVRESCGADFPILYRMSSQEYMDGGLTVEMTRIFARELEKAGVDCIHCSQGISANPRYVLPPAITGPAAFIENTEEIKRVVKIPVIGVGKINDPYVAEDILQDEKADLCTMARASLADPDMPNKVKNNQYDNILHCIGCLQGCIGENGKGNKVRCLVNPLTGMEDVYHIQKADTPKRVLVIGGGIAGCEAAIIAACRGHQVKLVEKEDRLGGQWIAASVPPGKADCASFIFWQQRMLNQFNVKVELGTEMTAEKIKDYSPDIVINAVGSMATVPPVPGLREKGVCAEKILRGKYLPGKSVVVIGGGLVGAETADHMSMHGSKVTIIEMLPDILNDGEAIPTACMLERFKKNHVDVITSAALKQVENDLVLYEKDGEIRTLCNIDTVVVATGRRNDQSWKEQIESQDYLTIHIGDANRVKNGYANIQEGFEAGLNI